MTPNQHAWRARQLIKACGGPSAAAQCCRLKKSRLSEFQTPGGGATMPMGVVDDLETFCGQPLYSLALAQQGAGEDGEGDLAAEACETTELAAALQAVVRRLPKGPLTRFNREEVLALCAEIEVKVRALMAGAEGAAS